MTLTIVKITKKIKNNRNVKNKISPNIWKILIWIKKRKKKKKDTNLIYFIENSYHYYM